MFQSQRMTQCPVLDTGPHAYLWVHTVTCTPHSPLHIHINYFQDSRDGSGSKVPMFESPESRQSQAHGGSCLQSQRYGNMGGRDKTINSWRFLDQLQAYCRGKQKTSFAKVEESTNSLTSIHARIQSIYKPAFIPLNRKQTSAF